VPDLRSRALREGRGFRALHGPRVRVGGSECGQPAQALFVVGAEKWLIRRARIAQVETGLRPGALHRHSAGGWIKM